jgi:alpha-mannosidase
MGYCTYHVLPQGESANESRAESGDGLENDLYRIKLDPSTGVVKSLVVKPGNWEVFDGEANVVARQTDRGDLWELYQGLDGGSKIAMTRKQPVPRVPNAKLSSQFKENRGTIRTGPVFSEFRVSHPFDNGRYGTIIRLYTGIRRIDITTSLVNNEKFVRYQALFPTTIRNGKCFHAIPFGAIERPAGIEFPAQDWVDYGDESKGLALLNIGLPGNVVTDGTMMLSLLRSHTLGAYGFGGGYEPGMSSDTGLQLGKERTLRYALVPHSGDWQDAGIFRDGMEFNNPLICRKVLPHGGALPKRWGLLEVSSPNVVVSALKPGRGGTAILRVYETTGRPASRVIVKLRARVLSAWECNLMEDNGPELKTENDSLQFDLGAFAIQSFKLRLDTLQQFRTAR